ncbi:MAG: hypothetical protein IJ766_00095 [Clostridia bacterium]|nr:hypothetical protein [Clostridia bacterium]
MRNNAKTKHYLLFLDDPALPGFVSGSKMYIGTEDDLLLFAQRLNENNAYPETASKIQSYFTGDRNAVHRIAYQVLPILVPLTILDHSHIIQNAYEWNHINTWGFPYRMGFSKAVFSQIAFLYDKKYYRCVRAIISDLYYLSEDGKRNDLKDGFWGNRWNFDVRSMQQGGFEIRNLLYVVEDVHTSQTAATDLLHSTDHINLKEFCDDIFADG